jgi:hypothetical protein
MTSQVPDWARDLVVAPQTAVEVSGLTAHGRVVREPSHTVEPRSDAERISAARLRAIERSKANNAPGAQYGFGYLPEYFEDCSGPETSTYDFEHLFFILYFLEDPKFLRLSLNHSDGRYNARTGVWTRGTSEISIQNLKDAVQNRIRELGTSECLLLEYLADARGIGQEYWREDLQTRIQKFKAA